MGLKQENGRNKSTLVKEIKCVLPLNVFSTFGNDKILTIPKVFLLALVLSHNCQFLLYKEGPYTHLIIYNFPM